MKFTVKDKPIIFFLAAGTVIFLLSAQPVMAAEAGSGWRPIYDLVMKWLNFGIMVFIAVKFGKDPIKAFLRGRRESLAVEIQGFEEKKQRLDDQVQETRQALEDSLTRFEKIKNKIISEGEEKKQKIIDQARQESELMFQQTKFQIKNQILHARQRLQAELVDRAVARAMEVLPGEVTVEDNQKFVSHYLDSLAAS